MDRWLPICNEPTLERALRCTIFVLLLVACTQAGIAEPVCAVGQTVDVDGWRITVHSFSALPADEWRKPAPGQVFCAVEVTLENRSGQIRFFMPEKQMTLLDGNGQAYALDHQAAVIAARWKQWTAPDGEISIGEEAHGAAAYQIPSASQGVHWIFRSSLLPGAQRVTFELGDLARP